ncbi:MAG: Trm112 family protein [Nitrospirales bacterium]
METDTASHDRGMIAQDLLKILCCPETKQDLRLLEPNLVEQLNQQIEKGELQTIGGQPVTEKIDGGLLRRDETVVYPIRDQIPVMLIEEGILIEKSGFS